MVIPAVALAIDRILFMVQRSLFPYQYDSRGVLYDAFRGSMYAAATLKYLIIPPQPLTSAQREILATDEAPPPT
jgi:hypothetical protein